MKTSLPLGTIIGAFSISWTRSCSSTSALCIHKLCISKFKDIDQAIQTSALSSYVIKYHASELSLYYLKAIPLTKICKIELPPTPMEGSDFASFRTCLFGILMTMKMHSNGSSNRAFYSIMISISYLPFLISTIWIRQ